MKGDLHTHTRISDGGVTVEEVFRLAKASRLDFISITDHDHLECYERDFALSEQYGVSAIHGTELSSYDYQRNRRVHILCYFPKNPAPIQKLCRRTTESRSEAGLEMAELVAQRYPITVEDIQATAASSNSIFKQHIMLTLMQAGFDTCMYGELWDKLFDSRHGECLRNCIQPDVRQTILQVKEAGGICVMAHPYTYDSIDLLDELIEEKMLDGIEVWSSKSNREQEEYLLSLAKKKNMIPTGGSDFHGMFASKASPLGSAYTPETSLMALLELKEKRWREE